MASEYLYTTIRGDTWDIMALDAYNEERLAHKIMLANPQYSDVLLFDAGVTIRIPIIEAQAAATLPPWKR